MTKEEAIQKRKKIQHFNFLALALIRRIPLTTKLWRPGTRRTIDKYTVAKGPFINSSKGGGGRHL